MTTVAAKRRVSSELVDGAIAAPSLDDVVISPRRRVRRVLGAASGTVWLCLAALYLWCPVHRFPEARPFQGRRWYNPYSDVTPASTWHKANLHVHAHAWSGLTNGRGSPDDVLKRYRSMGYDLAPVSNYQAIAYARGADPSALTVYEQGYNLRKMHFLAVGASSVDWLDYPLLQGRDEEQHRIDRLRRSARLVIVAHPRLRQALPDEDLRALAGYTAIEIGSYASRGVDAWNVALDAGRPVWGIANDDTHDADEPNEAGGFWTMIAAPTTDAVAVEDALVAGRAYAVFGRAGRADAALDSLVVVGDTMSVAFRGVPVDLQLVGTSGRVLATASGVHAVRWVLPCDAPWVRVVARTPRMRIFLEPMLRSESGALPRVEATVARTPTFVRRIMALMLLLIAVAPWIGRETLRLSRTDDERAAMALRNAA